MQKGETENNDKKDENTENTSNVSNLIKYDEIKEIYELLNTTYGCRDIYTDDFTSEQIFYQIENFCNKLIKKNEVKINSIFEKVNKQQQLEDTDDINNRVAANVNVSGGSEHVDRIEVDNKIVNESDDSEAFEKLKQEMLLDSNSEDKDYCDSVSEETISGDDLSDDIEDLKDLPASDLFKKLDKDIKPKE